MKFMLFNEENGHYMVADALLIKKDGDKIVDVILIENKMSPNAPFTERQIEAFNAVHNAQKTPARFQVKSNKKIDNAEHKLPQGTSITIEKENLVRISGSGNSEINNVTMDRIPKQEEIKR